ncbi:hypothetical protein PI93_013940 [Pandoraea fibrosis]|uniref:HNH endonuclease n=1 Tax=Pandoraea fibrosis TaxID=1891094 RepID=A0ABX6HSU5_9BURK|nr:hypothetical protein [Pandoraea fibrosis]QHE92821.1 hypothetical protein PJ20_014060 [Pandoraea fibrosis]QHF13622.1 hypothetical protein PI93_013940 [Pandoraea fibrosis]
MRFQPIADLDEGTYLAAIFRAKHQPRRDLLIAAQDRVLQRCEVYAEQLSILRPPPREEWHADVVESLQSCYNSATEPLNKLKDEILKSLQIDAEINLQRCPYCMLNDPKTWDHYLPKTYYPEYSSYHANMVYVCFGCNHRKHDEYHDSYLLYCHPYFTVPNGISLLHCLVSVSNDQLAIRYYCAAPPEHEHLAAIAEEHISRLRLENRFKGEAASLVSGFIGEIRTTFPRGISDVAMRNILRTKYAEAQSRLGVNAWDARLWHGLNQCREFCAYINRRIISNIGPSADGFDTPAPPPSPHLVA